MRAKPMRILDDHPQFLRKGIKAMAGDEKTGFQIVLFEHLQQARDADFGRKDAALNVSRAMIAAIAAYPASDRIDICAKGAYYFLGMTGPL